MNNRNDKRFIVSDHIFVLTLEKIKFMFQYHLLCLLFHWQRKKVNYHESNKYENQ